ncbi:acyl-CoA dehydrogenase family protein [Escherichia coli]
MTEPGAGSDNNSATTTYTRKNGKVYINGRKNLYYRCERVPVYAGAGARSATKDPKKAFTLWWVDSSKPGH